MNLTDVRPVDIRVLGPVSVAVGGRPVAIGSPKQRIVLAMLALHRRVSVDALAEELWRETPPASVAATVQTLVSRLRRTLESAGGAVAIEAEGGAYVLEAGPGSIDVDQFHALAARGRAAKEGGAPDAAAELFRQALAVWRGPALADLADRDFARVAAARLDEARLDVAEELAEAELGAGRPAAALETVEPLVAEHPFRERLRAQLMLGLYRLGRQAEALAAYQDLRRTLANELGLEPTEALQTLERRILQHSPELDCGEWRPGGPSRPERIPPVAKPGRPESSSTTPARAASPSAGALTRFVGRETELAELSTLLTGTRLLTITGVGGAGKTRLALELAARVEKQYADGAQVVELASVRDDRPLADDVLSTLWVDGARSTGLSTEEQLCHVLGDRELLLVLDNCEHVLDSAAGLAGTVLRRCPSVTILATSREVLSVAGETSWTAPGLSLPPAEVAGAEDLDGSDAAHLFIVRARTAQPGFGPGASNAGAIARICHRLDGIPLALELAAARVRVLGVSQLADRLDDRLRVLTSGPRSAPVRHQTLRAAMDWSFELLTAAEQQQLRRLAVFPQNFDLEAATAVAGDDADPIEVLDLLARLIDKSLVVPEGAADTARYRLLETVRQYAAEKLLDADESDLTRVRHRRHFVERIRSAYLAGTIFFGMEWAQQTGVDSENYNAALTSAAADGDTEAATVVLAGRGYSWFWGATVPRAVESLNPDVLTCPEPSLHVEGLMSLVAAGMNTGRWNVDDGVPIYERALAIADEKGTRADQGFACYYLGYLARSRGDSAAARSWMERALRCFTGIPIIGHYYAQYELGWIELTEGNPAAARDQFQSVLAVLEARPGWEIQVAHLRAGLALCEVTDGRPAAGLALSRRALDEARNIAFPGIVVMALVRASEVATLGGAVPGGELVEALRLLRRQGGLRWVAAALTMAAVAHKAHSRPDIAAQLLGGARSVAGILHEDPLPLAAIAAMVGDVRRLLEERLGTEGLAAAEAAGANLPVAKLLDLALAGLDA